MLSTRNSVIGALASALVLACLAGCAPARHAEDARPVPAAAHSRDVGVQLFEWTWDAIGAECTSTLGPGGYGWVLTSPPQEHITGAQWWTSYQPVSYRLESRLGTRAQFGAMVATCAKAGVDVVADAVLNHMTGQEVPGKGWAGSAYSHYDYPGLWSDAAGDFHHCDNGADDDISTYQDAAEVQSCELVNLADLATERPSVRARLHAYLEDLLSLGVKGFRIDAAKHMPARDVEAIVAGLPPATRIMSEVIRGSGEPITPEQYLPVGDVFEFSWGREVAGMVRGGSASLAAELGEGAGYAPSAKALIFVDNHDTERGDDALTYADEQDYVLANILMLATDYGRPVVFSGYAFSDRDAGPHQDATGAVDEAVCPVDTGPGQVLDDGAWVCEHRWTAVAGMVAWRSAVGSAPVTARWAQGDAVAMSRGSAGYVVINGGPAELRTSLATGLVAGRYCDAVTGRVAGDACTGTQVVVATDGTVEVTVPAGSAIALHVGARLG